jgi:hypothetical protein
MATGGDDASLDAPQEERGSTAGPSAGPPVDIVRAARGGHEDDCRGQRPGSESRPCTDGSGLGTLVGTTVVAMAGRASREQFDLAAVMRRTGASWAEIGAVLAHRYRICALEAMRIAHRWRQREVAEEWNRRWPEDMIDARHLSYWESWVALPGSGRDPHLSALVRLAELYQCTVADLVGPVGDFGAFDQYGGPVDRREFVTGALVGGLGVAGVPALSGSAHASALPAVRRRAG